MGRDPFPNHNLFTLIFTIDTPNSTHGPLCSKTPSCAPANYGYNFLEITISLLLLNYNQSIIIINHLIRKI